MFGPKLDTVFRSRWNALFWAAFVLLTAYCSVPAPDDGSAASSAADSAEAEKIAKLVATATGQKPAEKQSSHHANPWAKKPD